MYENQSLAETAVASQVFLSREALGEFIECVKGAAVMKDLSNAQSKCLKTNHWRKLQLLHPKFS